MAISGIEHRAAQWTYEDGSSFPFQTSVACIVLIFIAYGLRIGARHVQQVPFCWDDGLMFVAFVFAMATAVDGLLIVYFGMGRHIVTIAVEQPWFLDFDYIGVATLYVLPFVYLGSVTLPKLAILVLYLRIFQVRAVRWTCWLLMAIMILSAGANFVVVMAQCGSKMSYAWQPALWAGNCHDIDLHFQWAGFSNIITDVVMLILPLPSLWKVRVGLKVRIGLAVSFSVGSVGLVGSVARFVEFSRHRFSLDFTFAAGNTVGWAVIEPTMYFVSACMLTYRPLMTRAVAKTRHVGSMLPRLIASSERGAGLPGAEGNQGLSEANVPEYRKVLCEQDAPSEQYAWRAEVTTSRPSPPRRAYIPRRSSSSQRRAGGYQEIVADGIHRSISHAYTSEVRGV